MLNNGVIITTIGQVNKDFLLRILRNNICKIDDDVLLTHDNIIAYDSFDNCYIIFNKKKVLSLGAIHKAYSINPSKLLSLIKCKIGKGLGKDFNMKFNNNDTYGFVKYFIHTRIRSIVMTDVQISITI